MFDNGEYPDDDTLFINTSFITASVEEYETNNELSNRVVSSEPNVAIALR